VTERWTEEQKSRSHVWSVSTQYLIHDQSQVFHNGWAANVHTARIASFTDLGHGYSASAADYHWRKSVHLRLSANRA